MRVKISSIGAYVPERILSNHDLEKMVETSDQWITERTGIKERHIASEAQAASDLAYEASKTAIERAGLKPTDIDVIIVASVTTDSPFPSTACVLQNLLGASKAFAFDINAACSGFLYGLSIANSYIKSGFAKRVLVVGAEVLSKFVDWEDRATCVLFGDGAGAAVLEASGDESGIIDVQLFSDGSVGDVLTLPGGGSRYPTSEKTISDRLHYMKMRGNELFKVAVKSMEQCSADILLKNGIPFSDVDIMIPHQANYRIIQAAAKRLEMPMDRVYMNLEKYGNTSAASIPIALNEAFEKGLVKKGDTVLMAAFGAGLTWGSAVMYW